MITKENYRKIPLSEFITCKNREILELLRTDLEYLPEDSIDIKLSLNEIENKLFESIYEEESMISETIYPGHHITLHGGIRTSKSMMEGICTFCKDKYYPGTRIIRYRPLLWDKDDNTVYVVSSKIILREDCQHHLPTNIKELEDLMYHIGNWYTMDKEESALDLGNKTLYSEISARLGQIQIKALRKK